MKICPPDMAGEATTIVVIAASATRIARGFPISLFTPRHGRIPVLMLDYQELLREVDRMVLRLNRRYYRHLVCRSGCSSCCQHHLEVFPVEAAAIGTALKRLPASLRVRLARHAREIHPGGCRSEGAACPLLIEDRCAIYEQRPIICRTQGLPLLIEEVKADPRLDVCPLNFTAPGATAELDVRHAVPLEHLNTRLALTNLAFCRQAGLSPAEAGRRVPMRQIIMEVCSH